MAELTMPRLSDTMTEGTIARWLKQTGDQVEKGDILAEIETDKATMEIEAYERGTLQKIMVDAGELVPIGQVIAIIGSGDDPVAASDTFTSAPAPSVATTPTQQAPSTNGKAETSKPTTATADTDSASTERIKASPLARSLAETHGVDLHHVVGTGPGGRIVKDNVEEFVQHQTAHPSTSVAETSQAVTSKTVPLPAVSPSDAPLPLGAEMEPLSRMRRAIAHHMTSAKHGTPHFYVTSEINMEEVIALRAQIIENGASPVKISINDFIIKAMAKALHEYPQFNSSYVVNDQGQAGVVKHEHININVAIAVDEGLIVPVVPDADIKSLGTIAAEVKDLALRAREGKIKQSELEGGTFTVSNLGMFDVSEFIAIITPPQAGVLAIGSIIEKPVVRDGAIEIAHMMNVTLSADHRVVDGATAARCLHTFKRLMQSPLKLLV